MSKLSSLSFSLLCLPLALAACGDDDGLPAAPDGSVQPDAPVEEPDASTGGVPSTYSFESRFKPGDSSVSYSGQVFRQVLIAELNIFLSGLTTQVDTTPPLAGATKDALNFYFDFDPTTSGDTALKLTTTPPTLQTTFNAIGGANLRSKLAGNDAATDHKVWNTPGEFVGWSEGGTEADTPTELVQYWFGVIDNLAATRAVTPARDPDNNIISKVFVTAQGQDLQQLIQKFLLGAVALSQGNDDYLDDDVADKGLKSSNAQDGEKAYSALEHAWDEGFGYFGAARNYGDFSDDELAGKGGRAEFQGYNDASGDEKIDLLSEYNAGISTNCAKRDRAVSSSSAPTDFTKDAFDAFLKGRHIIATAGDTLTDDELADLIVQRDIISSTWEKCTAATVVHYINDTLADMEAFGDTAAYSFETHAKHWSELKGFSLGLQFNPRSPMLTGTRFADFHDLIGDAPVLANADEAAKTQYKADLLAARVIVAEAYGFAQANVELW